MLQEGYRNQEEECSKKHALSLPKCPQQGRSRFAVLSVPEHGKRATMSVRAVTAKPENAAGGFFQYSHKGHDL